MPDKWGRGIPVAIATSVIVEGHSCRVSSSVAAKKFSSGIRSPFMALMVIDDPYIHGTTLFPMENKTPLLVHSHTPKSLKVARKLLQMITRRNPHIIDVLCVMELHESSSGSLLKV